MEKNYQFDWPNLNSEQKNFTNSIISLLNCRRYLESVGFIEEPSKLNINIHMNTKIKFSNEIELTNIDFKKTINRDSVLEKMVIDKASLIPPKDYRCNWKYVVITSAHVDNNFYVFLCNEDTTYYKTSFFKRNFSKNIPRYFRNHFCIILNKDVITDFDLYKFETCKLGLYDALTEPSLKIYLPKVLDPIKPLENKEEIEKIVPELQSDTTSKIKPSKSENNFINPWDIDIPKIENKIMQQNSGVYS